MIKVEDGINFKELHQIVSRFNLEIGRDISAQAKPQRDRVDISEEGYRNYNLEKDRKRFYCGKRDDSPPVELDATGVDVLKHELWPRISDECRAMREAGIPCGFTDTMDIILNAYISIYREMEQGYADGTREIWVADAEKGKRRLSREEDFQRLDNAYQMQIVWEISQMNVKKGIKYAQSLFGIGWKEPVKMETEETKKADEKKLTEFMMRKKEAYLSQKSDYQIDSPRGSVMEFMDNNREFMLKMQRLFK